MEQIPTISGTIQKENNQAEVVIQIDQECPICYETRENWVTLKPCNCIHDICDICYMKMVAELDVTEKLKCPFCRGTVEAVENESKNEPETVEEIRVNSLEEITDLPSSGCCANFRRNCPCDRNLFILIQGIITIGFMIATVVLLTIPNPNPFWAFICGGATIASMLWLGQMS